MWVLTNINTVDDDDEEAAAARAEAERMSELFQDAYGVNYQY